MGPENKPLWQVVENEIINLALTSRRYGLPDEEVTSTLEVLKRARDALKDQNI